LDSRPSGVQARIETVREFQMMHFAKESAALF
jgi:hypothetical protein